MSNSSPKSVFFTWEAVWGKVLTPWTSFRDEVSSSLIGVSFVIQRKRHCASHFVALPSCQVLVGAYFLFDGVSLGFSQHGQGGHHQLERFFCGKKRRKIWRSILICIFWTIWKERNRTAFREGTLVVQRLKLSFVHNLWSWNRLYLGEEISSLIGFLEWLALR